VSGAFDGLAALVTGASSGIGRATALALADAGASVVAVARRAERLDGVVAEIEAAGGSAVAAVADVSDEDAAATAATRAVEMFGGLDVLVANAGAMLLGPVGGANTALWRRMIEGNVYGALYTARSAVPHPIRAAAGPRGVGDLVLVSSTAGRVSREGSAVYALTKHGLNAFGESLRQELAPRQVRVTLVEPGSVTTELLDHNDAATRERSLARVTDVERLAPSDVADAIVFATTRPPHVSVNEILVRPTGQVN